MSGAKILDGLSDAMSGDMDAVVFMTADQFRDRVHEALDNAAENEHWTWIMTADPKEVAEDMMAYDADIEGADVDMLIPHILSWQDKQREATRGA